MSTQTAPPPVKRPLPARTGQRPPKAPAPTSGRVGFEPIGEAHGHRICLFGPGGVGKTTQACLAPGPLGIFDLDDSLAVLRPQLPQAVQSQIRLVGGIQSWQAIRDALHMPGWEEIKTIIIDSATRAEELAVAHTLATVPHEKGQKIARIEDYGYGKGYQHVYDTFLTLLADLDAHVRAGRHVILICHDCTNNVPNPQGEDWIRYEPRLQSPASGKSSIRLRVREWADHVLFYGHDIVVNKDGKGRASGSRTVYPAELPHCMAKSRTLADPIPVTKDDRTLWTRLLDAAQ
jgi:hypothetical protein